VCRRQRGQTEHGEPRRQLRNFRQLAVQTTQEERRRKRRMANQRLRQAVRRRAGEEQHRIHRLLRQAEKRFFGGQGGLAAGFLAQILNFRPKLGKRQRIIRQKQKTARLHEKNLH